MKQISNAYTLYFNQKNSRVGGLMQGRFKAFPITEDNLLNPEDFEKFHIDQEHYTKELDKIKHITIER